MAKLVEQLDGAVAKEKSLTNQYETAERKCERAKSLIEKLKDEEKNWAIALEKTRKDKINVVGDIMLSSGVIAYLGVFASEYRAKATTSWLGLCNECEVKASQDFTLEKTLGAGVKIQRWYLEGLPQESFAVENAIIMDNSSRWPLMIDPQMQGSKWINGMERKPKIIKPTMDIDKMQRILKACLAHGEPILFEDAQETFEPLLDPVLGKAVTKTGTMTYIKIGED